MRMMQAHLLGLPLQQLDLKKMVLVEVKLALLVNHKQRKNCCLLWANEEYSTPCLGRLMMVWQSFKSKKIDGDLGRRSPPEPPPVPPPIPPPNHQVLQHRRVRQTLRRRLHRRPPVAPLKDGKPSNPTPTAPYVTATRSKDDVLLTLDTGGRIPGWILVFGHLNVSRHVPCMSLMCYKDDK
ncbi:hypothetical protein HPP92_010177 [Vanilla planifolia]|uniref:Uncharacterized protein n=1 Tax=Vanilla planifolia TaxID=51239 RepID=A0A835V285_VANPL|nr:hypothetical protein HPP92_010177 [Vanilla planifolia]